MSINYQQLDRYKGSLYGSLQYNGIEYDFEVSDNQVVGSPGGLSSTHHHYTKGMYSPEVSYSDIYGGTAPAYPYGEFGNLYQTGQSSPYYMGVFQQPRERMFTQNGGMTRIDNFAPGMEKGIAPSSNGGGSMEMIPPPDTTVIVDPSTGELLSPEQIQALKNAGRTATSADQSQHILDTVGPKLKNVISLPSAIELFVLLFLMWMAFDFGMYAMEGFISAKFHGGQPLNWKWNAVYAVVFAILLIIAAKFINISIINLEGVKN
jgi:hypothetical protein